MMHEASDSFGERYSETFVSLPLPPRTGRTSQSRSQIFKAVSSCWLISISSLFLSFRPLPEPRCSSDLTSSEISCLLLEPCCLSAGTGDALVLHLCAKTRLGQLFFLSFSYVCVKMLASRDNRKGVL